MPQSGSQLSLHLGGTLHSHNTSLPNAASYYKPGRSLKRTQKHKLITSTIIRMAQRWQHPEHLSADPNMSLGGFCITNIVINTPSARLQTGKSKKKYTGQKLMKG